ncbi:cytochrome-c peroxidase [Sinirhodobacter sp. WL0062]|uniref:Cytochrome-c peroxidase n=1 Tax=Rhodobacter flavimaris TaxID=2907145 RepID=A0ABS8Z027_9RHOB|nr:cytochrome c peroxidase [Sinirhodobacter sp. WL0062]MCE5974104.1 cytochrome-c peroxidase [Sinirhodobacter sp. WL0062]
MRGQTWVWFGAAWLAATSAVAQDLPRAVTDDDYAPVNRAEAELGQLLFFDPILSGNRNISCASCHHPRFATSDGLSLGLGEGAVGLGPDRHVTDTNIPEQRIPRNSPALFNLAANEFTRLFHDGRIEADPSRPSGLRTPMEDEMVTGFVSILSAQTMFPVLSPDEMAGHYSENEIAKAVRSGRITGEGGAWDRIAARIATIPAYQAGFESVYPEIAAGRALDFTDISNAIAAFVAFEWRSDTSPFDAALRGAAPLTPEAAAGAKLFYGAAGCADCHSGPFLTDHQFHAMSAPQLGPGKAERFESHSRDEGRARVTNRAEDRFAFRTPSLRNVARTGPWGHAGAHRDLASFVADHAARAEGLARYKPQAILPEMSVSKNDWAILEDAAARAEIAATASPGIALSAEDVSAIIAFLESLTDPQAIAGRLGIPETVPSGLSVER